MSSLSPSNGTPFVLGAVALALALAGCSGRDTAMAEKLARAEAAAQRAETAADRAEASAKRRPPHASEPADDEEPEGQDPAADEPTTAAEPAA